MKERLRGFVLKASEFVNKNTGWLIATAIVFFGLANIGFQKDNRTLIESTNHTAETTKNIAVDTKTIIENLNTAVRDLKADNEQQTLILCRLILRGDVPLNDEEVADVEKICKEQIKRASLSLPTYHSSSVGVQTTPEQKASPSPTGNVGSAPKPVEPAPETPQPQPGLLDRAVQGVTNLLNAISKEIL